jgi:hypothetical protein
MRFIVQGVEAIIHGVRISGGLTADAIVEGAFSGEVDMRDYRDLLGDDGCTSLENYFGLSCNACRTDGEVQCLWLEAVDANGEIVPGLRVVPNPNPTECTDTGGS